MEVRQSARQISIKRFYKENSSSEEEKKKGNLGLLCHMKGSIQSFYRTHSLKTQAWFPVIWHDLQLHVPLLCMQSSHLPSINQYCLLGEGNVLDLLGCVTWSLGCLVSFCLFCHVTCLFQKIIKTEHSPPVKLEVYQMPKQSCTEDRKKSMTGDMDTVSRKRKSTDTVTKETPKRRQPVSH